jgi:hypothetical protein
MDLFDDLFDSNFDREGLFDDDLFDDNLFVFGDEGIMSTDTPIMVGYMPMAYRENTQYNDSEIFLMMAGWLA